MIRRLPREMGIVLCCDGTDETVCNSKMQTANVMAGANRSDAKKQGWGRGLRKGRKRMDYCPEHMAVERELFAKQQAERQAEIARRDELKKAKMSAAPLPKKPRKRKSSAAPASSPSADYAPAPST